VKFVDMDGRKIVDVSGNIIYTHKTGWSANAPEDAIRLGNAMMLTKRGTTQFNAMVDAEHGITLNISPENKFEEGANGTKYVYGRAIKNTRANGELLSVDIIVYEGTLNTILKGGKAKKAKLYQRATDKIDEAIGAVATHESVHATSEKNIQQTWENEMKGTNNDVEKLPEMAEYGYLYELIWRKSYENKEYKSIIFPTNLRM
jgi:hypothetical protein